MGSGIVEIANLGYYSLFKCSIFIHVGSQFVSPITAEILLVQKGPRLSQMWSGIVEITDLGFFGPLFIYVDTTFLSPIGAEISRV